MTLMNRPHPPDAAPHPGRDRPYRPDGLDPDGTSRPCVTMELGMQAFALDVAMVREILEIRPITPLPNAPPDLLGMIDLRGESIAVIDVTARLGLPHRASDPERILVLDLEGGHGAAIGVIADRVLNVIDLAPEDIEPPPDTRIDWSCNGMLGIIRIGGRQTILLDPTRLLGRDAGDGLFFG